MKRAIIAAVAAVSVATLALTGCSADATGPQASASPVPGGDLVMARDADASNLLAQEVSANADIWLLQQVYQTLTVNREDGTGVDPELATSWEQAADGLSWTFDLRDGVKFADGSEMTAEDVKWSLDFARTPSDTNAWSDSFTPITQVEVVDDDTIKIDLSSPWAPLPAAMALFAAPIYKADFGGQTAEYMRSHTNGTGPFMLDSWTQGQSIKLVKNPNYWEAGLPYLDSVTFTTVADDNTRFLQLQGGQIQIDEFPSPATMKTLSSTAGVTAQEFPSTQVMYVNINNRVVTDPKVRRAMSYAVDRDSIISTILAGYGTAANSYLSPSLFGHTDDTDGAEYDMDKAKSLMQEAGGAPLTLDMTLPSGNSVYQQIAQVLQQSWSQLGITLNISVQDTTSIRAMRRAGEFGVLINYATSDVADPYQMTDFLVLTDGSGVNAGHSNADVEAAAAQAITEQDSAKRADLYAQIQTTTTEEAPILPVAYQPSLYAFKNTVHGFASAALGTYTLKTTWIEH